MKIMGLRYGLGNAMFQYAVYLQLKRLYPDEQVFLDTIWYDFAKYPFELESIFHLGIDDIDAHKLIERKYGISFEEKLEPLRYWKDYGYETFLEHGRACRRSGKLTLDTPAKRASLISAEFLNTNEIIEVERPYLDDFELYSPSGYSIQEMREAAQKELSPDFGLPPIKLFFSKLWGDNRGVTYQAARSLVQPERRKKMFDDIFHGRKPDFTGFHSVSRLKRNGNVYFNIHGTPNDCEGIRDELLRAFAFPAFNTERNNVLAQKVSICNSVAIHARVMDYSYGMKDAVANNYYGKAVRYVRKRVCDPAFFVFSDNPAWCREHTDVLGLSEKDSITYVDWNTGKDSFRDMQLISLCKHQIVPNSTFSWWGGYLNRNPEKVFVTPYATFPGTISF